jgi:hypothetical protein
MQVGLSGYYLTLSFSLSDYVAGGRYRVRLPALSLKDAAGNLGPTENYDLEFVDVPGGFSYADTIRALPMSTEDTLMFSVAVDSTPAGEYNMCYCSGQLDENLETLGDDASTYVLVDDTACLAEPRVDPAGGNTSSDALIMGFSLEDHVCSTKCSRGCIGPHCFCDGFTPGTEASLCLPKALCAEACSSQDDCAGFVVHDTLPTCELVSTTCSEGDEETFQYFKRLSGTACTHIADFTEKAGTVVVTERVHVSVDYVFTPMESGSIEVTAAGDATLLTSALGSLSLDRITVIDCSGTCGVSSPTTSLLEPAHAEKISTWNAFSPYIYFEDPVHIDVENPTVMPPLATYPEAPAAQYVVAGLVEGYYVEGSNVDVNDPTALVAIDGDMRPLNEHACYKKCSAGCEGKYCEGCSGYYHGYDSETSNAICADQTLCQYLCDGLGSKCASIDMHLTLPRCYLNVPGSSQDTRDLTPDPSYKVLLKREDPYNTEKDTSYTVPLDPAPDEKSILAVRDFGYSWEKMLRFKDLKFASGGTFKLCFCDSAIVGRPCKSEKDYSVEIGTIHASGVSCLIAKKELQRVNCLPTKHGSSLRCYQHGEAPNPTPPTIDDKTVLVGMSGAYAPDAGAGLPDCPFGKKDGVCLTPL